MIKSDFMAAVLRRRRETLPEGALVNMFGSRNTSVLDAQLASKTLAGANFLFLTNLIAAQILLNPAPS